jgi:hypothetical protein
MSRCFLFCFLATLEIDSKQQTFFRHIFFQFRKHEDSAHFWLLNAVVATPRINGPACEINFESFFSLLYWSGPLSSYHNNINNNKNTKIKYCIETVFFFFCYYFRNNTIFFCLVNLLRETFFSIISTTLHLHFDYSPV